MIYLEPSAATLSEQSFALCFGCSVEARFLRPSDWAVWVRHWVRAAHWTWLQRRPCRHLWGIRAQLQQAACSRSWRCWRRGGVFSALGVEAAWGCCYLSSLWREKHRRVGPAWACGSVWSRSGWPGRVWAGCGQAGHPAAWALAPICHLWISAAKTQKQTLITVVWLI